MNRYLIILKRGDFTVSYFSDQPEVFKEEEVGISISLSPFLFPK